MSKISLKTAYTAFAVAAVSASCAFAQEAAEEEKSADEKPAVAVASAKAFRFLPLMRCEELSGGVAEIRAEGSESWEKVVQGRYYPFGSDIRLSGKGAGNPVARFVLGTDASVTLEAGSCFSTRAAAIGEQTRAIVLKGGAFTLSLPRALKDGVISVVSPDFVCENLSGESRFAYSTTTDTRECVIRVVTGALSFKGMHYHVARMGVANQVRIISQEDKLFTALYGESGDCKVSLDCGVKSILDPESGNYRNEPQTIEYTLSPKCAAKIWRKVSEKEKGGSGRMAVAVQTFDAQGKDKNFRAFFEERAEVNSGELVKAPTVVKVEKKENSGEESAEGEGSEGAEEKSEEKSEDGEKSEGAASAGDGL